MESHLFWVAFLFSVNDLCGQSKWAVSISSPSKKSSITGYWLLVIGYWLLVIGYWLLVIGYWLLEFRKYISKLN